MKKLFYPENWLFDKKTPNEERFVELDIHLEYPAINDLIQDTPWERTKKVNQDLKDKFKNLIETKLFSHFELIGTNNKPRGIKTKIKYDSLIKLESLDLDCIGYVSIKKIDKAKEKKAKPTQNFYCVKMTVAIEIEGKNKGLQTIEERFVLIKAKSFDDAYDKLEAKKGNYGEPYLNSSGELVRWKIERFDDCYITDIHNFKDLNDPDGVEVYSKLKTRRLTKERTWDGNMD